MNVQLAVILLVAISMAAILVTVTPIARDFGLSLQSANLDLDYWTGWQQYKFQCQSAPPQPETKVKQEFVPTVNGSLDGIDVRVCKEGNPGDLTVGVYNSDANGYPTGSPMGTAVVPASTIGSLVQPCPTLSVSFTNVTLTAGQHYVLLLSAEVYSNNLGDPQDTLYIDVSDVYYNDYDAAMCGGAWSGFSGSSLNLRTYMSQTVTTAPPAPPAIDWTSFLLGLI